jgi:tight adherence protein C
MFSAISANSGFILSCLAAMSVFLALVVVFWPYFTPDHLANRMRRMTDEREAIRIRERAVLHAGPASTLRSEPKKLLRSIFDRLNLAKQAGDGKMVQSLRMAGYRGQGPIVTFLVVRVTMPVVFALAGLSVFLLYPQLPFFQKIAIVMAAALLGNYAPAMFVRNRISKRQQSIGRAWPDALDLTLICVESGMGVESAFRKVAEEVGTQSPELAEELALTTAELSYLPDRRQAYENLATRTGLDSIKGVVTCLLQSEKYGTPVGQSLRVFAQEERDTRMSAAEKKAAMLPPKLTVPMIIFFLPVLFAVLITPACIQIMQTPST